MDYIGVRVAEVVGLKPCVVEVQWKIPATVKCKYCNGTGKLSTPHGNARCGECYGEGGVREDNAAWRTGELFSWKVEVEYHEDDGLSSQVTGIVSWTDEHDDVCTKELPIGDIVLR